MAEGLFIEITRGEVEFKFEQETSCFAAGGSGGFLVEGDFGSGHFLSDLLGVSGWVEVEILRPEQRPQDDTRGKAPPVQNRF